MHKYARETASKSVEVFAAGRPFSDLDFIEDRFGGLATLARLMSQVRVQGFETLVAEVLKPSQDVREEDEDLGKVAGTKVASDTLRLSFFSKRFKRAQSIDNVAPEDFLGYAILKKDTTHNRWRVFESVLRRKAHGHNFVRGEQPWTCKVGSRPLVVPGYVYAEQNGVTNVCAHAALRTSTARFLPGGFSYREMNDLVGIDHKKKKAGIGLRSDQIVKILEHAGARCFVGDFTLQKKPNVPFQKYIYNSIESGFPAISSSAQ